MRALPVRALPVRALPRTLLDCAANPLLLLVCLQQASILAMAPLCFVFAAICLPLLLASTAVSATAVNPGCECSCRW